jgi:hypothetical protein
MRLIRSREVARLLGAGLALAGLLAVLPAALSQAPPAKAAPTVVLRATQREGLVSPVRQGSALTGGGAVAVAQPSPDTLVLTLTGVAAAKANPCGTSLATLEAWLAQNVEVVLPGGGTSARLIVEGRLNGLLRSAGTKSGSAEMVSATAAVLCGGQQLANLELGPRGAAGCDALAVHLAQGPVCVNVGPGCHTVQLNLRLSAAQGKAFLPHIASAEFAPPPALPANWVRNPDPHNGVDRSGLGFQITIRAEAAEPAAVPAKTP